MSGNVQELSWVQRKLIDKCEKECYMVGRLRSNYSAVPTDNRVRFFIDPLCNDPRPIYDIDIFRNIGEEYIGFDNQQEREFLPDFYDDRGYNMIDRVNDITNFYRDKLIVFSPSYTTSKDNRWYKNAHIAKMLNDDEEKYKLFIHTPSVNMDPYDFEEILKNKEYFDIPDYDYEIYGTPELIVCGKYAYFIKEMVKPIIIANISETTRWKCDDFDNIVKIDFSKIPGYKEYIFRVSESLVFVEDCLRNEIEVSKQFVPLLSKEIVEEILENDDKEDTNLGNFDDDTIANEDNEEINFLRGLQIFTSEKKLLYRFDDIVNFHTSVKTNPLTILAGMSGTGKTQLAYNYAKMLNLSEDNNTLLFMPISPSYSEPSDVLGYLNTMDHNYVPAETGLVDFLINASENINQMHMVIFDEMNLSQIEYWFSPFISILEKDANDRYLRLYDDNAKCENKNKYPYRIKIYENLIFVGTVNIDETTKDFSDRLLDRTFVISLQKGNFVEFYENFSKGKAKKEDYFQYKCKDASMFMRWNARNSSSYLSAFDEHTNELKFLDEFDKVISKYIPNGGVSYRVLRNIGNFILNVPKKNNDEMIIDRNGVFDTIVNQTIMQKIRGTESQLACLIGISGSKDYSIENSDLYKLLDKYNNVSTFESVRKTLNKKAEDLRLNGYTN